tara:strand:- start:21 stop:590 length:570 start_codon:yes stop_codon:yes gene_type:complete
MPGVLKLLNDTNSVDEGHLPAILRQHTLTEGASGSVFDLDAGAVMEQLVEGEFRHLTPEEKEQAGDAIQPDCQYYILEGIGGLLGVYPIFPDETGLRICRDKKGCPLALQGTRARSIRTSILTMIVGPHEGQEIIYTFHPGLPIKPSSLQIENLTPRHQEMLFSSLGSIDVTYEEAVSYGFRYAKCHGA